MMLVVEGCDLCDGIVVGIAVGIVVGSWNVPDVAFFISSDMACLRFNINQKAKHFRTGSPIIHVCAADVVIPFHIGDQRNRGSSEHHGWWGCCEF